MNTPEAAKAAEEMAKFLACEYAQGQDYDCLRRKSDDEELFTEAFLAGASWQSSQHASEPRPVLSLLGDLQSRVAELERVLENVRKTHDGNGHTMEFKLCDMCEALKGTQ
jgi:hypothetical protein